MSRRRSALLSFLFHALIQWLIVQMAKGKASKEPVTREYTVNIHKRVHKTTFKERAPKAIKQIKAFAQKIMGTKDVRVDVKLNKLVWSQGVRNVPNRVRIQISRRRNDDEDAKEEMYSFVTMVSCSSKSDLIKTLLTDQIAG
jgi:large subunit ribosomal protein L31e